MVERKRINYWKVISGSMLVALTIAFALYDTDLLQFVICLILCAFGFQIISEGRKNK